MTSPSLYLAVALSACLTLVFSLLADLFSFFFAPPLEFIASADSEPAACRA